MRHEPPNVPSEMISAIRNAPLPIVLLAISFLFPSELSAEFAGLRLPPHRVALLILGPIATYKLVFSAGSRIKPFDVLIFLYGAWVLYVFTSHGAQAGGFVYGGSIALESFGAYVISRAYVRDVPTLRATLAALLVAVILAGLIALPETLLGRHFTHDLLQQVTGRYHPRALETRLGLTRAYGTFDHPIHLGTFAATLLAMSWYASARLKQAMIRAGLVLMTTFAALSSAPLLCLMVQVSLISWDRVTRSLKGRVKLTALAIVLGFVAVSMMSSRSPFALIATGLTLDPWTGYYRLLIWEYGLANVWQHPWLGLGLNDWERAWWMASASIDAFWLVVAMQTGIPAFLLLVTALVWILFAIARVSRRINDPQAHRLARAWVMSLLALTLLACTVHFWNVMHAYFFFFIGLSGWIADPSLALLKGTDTARDRRTSTASERPKRRPAASPPQTTVGHAPQWAPLAAQAIAPAGIRRLAIDW